MYWLPILLAVLFLVLLLWVAYDVTQRRHAILRNFPIIGHFRYWLEKVGPELRQYIVTSNNEERPFSRDQRTWVYATSKQQNSYFGFGTDNDLELSSNYLIIKHSAFPLCDPEKGAADYDASFRLPCAKVMGGYRQRRHAFRPASLVNVSGMSYGSMSANAIEALNRGSQIAGCLHNTGEGGVSPHHLHGGELIVQIGTGYFGCRDQQGNFDLSRLQETVQAHSVRAIEIKLSQGAKPGLGGLLPAAKVTEKIAEIRGIPVGKDCASPARHSAFHDVDSLLDFVEMIADATGLPVGIKSAVGELNFWQDLARQMATTERGVDFITVDGGEGGTGAAPLVFADHVAQPFKIAIKQVYRAMAKEGLQEHIVFGGSGKLGFPEAALFACALGCDLVHVGRTAMLALGCIQAQRCHTGHCPAGVATQNRWLMGGLDPTLKAARLANYVVALRMRLLQLSRACGVPHPAFVTLEQFDILDERLGGVCGVDAVEYLPEWGRPSAQDRDEIVRIMAAMGTENVG